MRKFKERDKTVTYKLSTEAKKVGFVLRSRTEILFISIILFITFIIFKDFFLNGLIPFPANLLVSFFSPWNTMSFPGWEHGVPFKPMGLDNLNLFYPYKDLSISLMKEGQWPLWNPYNFTGNVLLANFQSSIFYPLNILYFIFPMINAWSLLVLIQPLLAGFFTYLFLRCFPLGKISAFFGALVFSLSGEMIVWMSDHLVVSHTILWLPLILFGIEKFLTYGKWCFYAIAVLGLAFSFFAGFFQPFFYVFTVSLLYLLFRLNFPNTFTPTVVPSESEGRKGANLPKKITLGLSIFIISFGIVMIQFLPSLEALLLSPRNIANVNYLYDTFLMPISHLFSFLAPDYLGNPSAYNFFGQGAYHESVLYIGIIPLSLALYSFKRVNRDNLVKFFWFITIATLVLGLNTPFVRALYDLKLPIFHTFLPSRIFFITTFALSILAAFGMEELFKRYDKKAILKILIVLFMVITLFWVYSFLLVRQGTQQWEEINQFIFRLPKLSINNIQVLQKNLILPTIITLIMFIIIISNRFKKFFFLAIFFLTIFPQIYFAQKYLFFSQREFLYPTHPVFDFLKENAGVNRFWTYGDGYITANFSTYYRVFSPEGTDALFPSRLGELFYATETKGKLSSAIPRIDARIARASEGERMTDNLYRLRLLSLVGAKYITDWTKTEEEKKEQEKKFPPSLFNLIWEKDDWKIYEYKNVLPRAFLTNRFIVETDKQKILDRIFDPLHDLTTVTLEGKPDLIIEPTKTIAEVKILSYDPNKVTIKVNNDKNALLFLSDSFYPGWNAYIDGVKSKVYRANYAFRAVAVPAGAKTVIFSYEPESFKWGVFITTITSITLLVIISFISKNENIKKYGQD